MAEYSTIVSTRKIADSITLDTEFTVENLQDAILEKVGVDMEEHALRGRLRAFQKKGLVIRVKHSPAVYSVDGEQYMGLIELHEQLIEEKVTRGKSKSKPRGRPPVEPCDTERRTWGQRITAKPGDTVLMISAI